MTGEDLGYKPGVVEKVKFECYPLVEVFNKVLKKDDKSKFSEISSTDGKFDTLSKIYKDFKKLNISKWEYKGKEKNCTKTCIIAL